MARGELTPFSYAILALVGEGGAGPHDIVRMMRQGRMYWSAAESHYYAEPKRLEGLGYLVSRKEPGRTRERTHYELTDRGREALRAWIAEPAGLPRIQHEAIVRLLAADLSDDETVRASLAAMRADIADAYSELETGEAIARAIPHRQRYLLLVHGLGRRLLAAHEEWLDDVERELAGSKSPGRSSVR
jgi:PadR family transcriptional regulator, regulatory protein AphA